MTVLWLLLQGCGVSENHYWKERADIACDKKKKCDGQGFNDEYDSKGDCKDAVLTGFDDLRTSYDDCEFDGGAAADCLGAERKQDCDEVGITVPDVCSEVYDCL
jgi:hypothetical protein